MPTIMKSILGLLAATSTVTASGYVQFCENYSNGRASGGCGIAVATQNSGCLKESGRHSLHFTESDGSLYYPVMVAYHDNNCQHEKGCNALGMGGSEQDISFNFQAWKFAEGALSYKFIHGSPPKCPSGCVGQCGKREVSRVMQAREVEEKKRIDDNMSENVTNDLMTVAKRQDGNNDSDWFCDDANCKKNCGNHIEPATPGCANGEHNRKSVFMKGLHVKSANLAAYDNNKCDGTPVKTVEIGNGCHQLPGQHNSWNVIGFQD